MARAARDAAKEAQPYDSPGARMIAAERRRQITSEGWTPEHDDEHDAEEMACAAISYIIAASRFGSSGGTYEDALREWPWDREWFKPSTPVRDLAKAGALIAAEIDRITRAAIAAAKESQPERSGE